VGASYVKVSAGYIEVQPEIPLAAAYEMKAENFEEGLALMLVDPADAKLLWPTLTAEDFDALINFVTGKTLGESEA
jgi:hypothetical protein